MHPALINAYVRELPRLRAQEALHASTVIATALGGDGADKQYAAWEREVSGPPPPPDPREMLRKFATWGVPVRAEEAP